MLMISWTDTPITYRFYPRLLFLPMPLLSPRVSRTSVVFVHSCIFVIILGTRSQDF